MKGGSGVSTQTLNGCEGNLRRTRLPCCSASAVSSSPPWIFSSAGREDRRIRPQLYRAFAVATNYEWRFLEGGSPMTRLSKEQTVGLHRRGIPLIEVSQAVAKRKTAS